MYGVALSRPRARPYMYGIQILFDNDKFAIVALYCNYPYCVISTAVVLYRYWTAVGALPKKNLAYFGDCGDCYVRCESERADQNLSQDGGSQSF